MSKTILELSKKWWFWIIPSILLYINTLKHEYVIDDIIVVSSNNQTKEGISAIPEIFAHSYLYGYDGREDMAYRPLTLTTFAIERSLFDADPNLSHLIQILLYALTIMLLFKLLFQLFGELKMAWVFGITALFMLHPIHTEVVANVKSRDELLCALFLFWSLILFIKYLRIKSKKSLVISLLLYFFALLSKETAATAILIFPAIMWFFEKSTFKEIVLKSLPLVVPAVIYVFLRSSILSDVLIGDEIDPVANNLVLANSPTEAFATNLVVFLKYIQLSIFPITLSWDYSINAFPLVDFGNFQVIIGLLLLVSLVGILVFGILKRSIFGFGALIFISTFIATSNFIFLIFCVLGERFLFIPVLGMLILLVPLMDKLLGRIYKHGALLLFIAVSAYFGFRTISRNQDWKSNMSIYEAGVKAVPNSVKTHFNLGTEYITQGNIQSDLNLKKNFYRKALNSLQIAVSIYKNYVNTYENQAFIYGELYKLSNDKNEKIEYLLKGKEVLNFALDTLLTDRKGVFTNQLFIYSQLILIETDTVKRNEYLQGILNLCSRKKEYDSEDFHHEIYALNELKRYSELINLVELKAVNYPEKADLVAEMGRMAFARNDFELSYRFLVQYLRMRPEDLSSLSNKGMLLEILGRKDEAMKVYEEVLQRDPNQQHAKELYEKLKLSR